MSNPRASRLFRWFRIIVCQWLISILALILLIFSCWNWIAYLSTRRWVETSATIEHLSIQPYRANETLPREGEDRWDGQDGILECVYEYSFEGATFTGDRIGAERFRNTHRQADRFQEMREAFELGRPIQILVNPQDPERSVIYREIHGNMIASPVFAIFWFTAFGVYLVRNRKSKPEGKKKPRTELKLRSQ